jgi:hypothetical protein
VKCICVFSVTLYLPCLVCDASPIAFLFIFIHLHLASHLGTLAEAREEPVVEPNPKTVFGGSIPKIEGPDK